MLRTQGAASGSEQTEIIGFIGFAQLLESFLSRTAYGNGFMVSGGGRKTIKKTSNHWSRPSQRIIVTSSSPGAQPTNFHNTHLQLWQHVRSQDCWLEDLHQGRYGWYGGVVPWRSIWMGGWGVNLHVGRGKLLKLFVWWNDGGQVFWWGWSFVISTNKLKYYINKIL